MGHLSPAPPALSPTAQPRRDPKPDAAHVFGYICSFALPLVGRAETERISVRAHVHFQAREGIRCLC